MAKRPHQYITASAVIVGWECPSCKAVNTEDNVQPRLEHVGGCGGHGPDEYCYCPRQETEFETKCSACKTDTTVKVSV